MTIDQKKVHLKLNTISIIPCTSTSYSTFTTGALIRNILIICMFIMGVKEISSEIKYHYCLYLKCYITLYVSKHTSLLYLTFLFLVSFEEPRTRSATSTLSYYKSPSTGNSLRPSAKGIIEGKEEPRLEHCGCQLQKQCQ